MTIAGKYFITGLTMRIGRKLHPGQKATTTGKHMPTKTSNNDSNNTNLKQHQFALNIL